MAKLHCLSCGGGLASYADRDQVCWSCRDKIKDPLIQEISDISVHTDVDDQIWKLIECVKSLAVRLKVQEEKLENTVQELEHKIVKLEDRVPSVAAFKAMGYTKTRFKEKITVKS